MSATDVDPVSAETVNRMAVNVAELRAEVDQLRDEVRAVAEGVEELRAVVRAVSEVIERFGPMADQLAEGGPGAMLAMLARSRGD